MVLVLEPRIEVDEPEIAQHLGQESFRFAIERRIGVGERAQGAVDVFSFEEIDLPVGHLLFGRLSGCPLFGPRRNVRHELRPGRFAIQPHQQVVQRKPDNPRQTFGDHLFLVEAGEPENIGAGAGLGDGPPGAPARQRKHSAVVRDGEYDDRQTARHGDPTGRR